MRAKAWAMFDGYGPAEDHCCQVAGDTADRYCVVETFGAQRDEAHPFLVMSDEDAEKFLERHGDDAEIVYTCDYRQRSQIGDVHVTDTECENPYRYQGAWRIGDGRVAALRAFRDGGDTTGMQLWYAPANGGARRITVDDVDWRGLR